MTNTGRLLLTGSGGFIGSAVAVLLARRGVDVLAPRFADLDLTDRRAVVEHLGEAGITMVLHLASHGMRADAQDASVVTRERAMIEALCAVLAEGSRFLYAGSMSEYGRSGLLDEAMECWPQTAYGRAKLEAGLWLRRVAPGRGIVPVVARIFGAYGPGEAPKRLLPTVLGALRAGRPVDLSDGRQIRDFVHVRDVADALLQLAELPAPPDCVNIGTGEGLEVRAVIERLGQELGRPSADLRFGARKRSPHDLDVQVADVSRLRAALGTAPPQRLSGPEPIAALMAPEALFCDSAGPQL